MNFLNDNQKMSIMQEVTNEKQHLSDLEQDQQHSELGYEQDIPNQFTENSQEIKDELKSQETNQESANDDTNQNSSLEKTTENSHQTQITKVHYTIRTEHTITKTERQVHANTMQIKSTDSPDEQIKETKYSRTSPTKSRSAQINPNAYNNASNNKGKRTRPQIFQTTA